MGHARTKVEQVRTYQEQRNWRGFSIFGQSSYIRLFISYHSRDQRLLPLLFFSSLISSRRLVYTKNESVYSQHLDKCYLQFSVLKAQ